MQWFKHQTNASSDPIIDEAEDKFGDAGYCIYFKILEIYGAEFGSLSGGVLIISKSFVRRKLRKSWVKVEKVLRFYQENAKLSYEIVESRVHIRIPKFIEISSNWTKRQDTQPTEAPTEAPTAREVDKNRIEEEKNKRNTKEKKIFNKNIPCPHQKIIDLYHKIFPTLSKIRIWNSTSESNLKTRWNETRERQNLEWWESFFIRDIQSSSFLMGDNNKNWSPTLSWMVKPVNFAKILNGAYVDRGPKTGTRKSDKNLQICEEFANG